MSQVSGRKDGYEILHDNPATPGTSGGPLLDTNGRLVGINGESIFDVNSNKSFGAGIPIALYLENSSEGIAATNTSPPTDLISLGERKAKTGDYQGAIAYYNQAIKSNPHNLKAYYLRGEAYLKWRNCVLGLEDFNRVIALDGQNTCHSELGNKREAMRNYNKAIEIYPDFARAYYNRDIIRTRDLHLYEDALRDFNNAIFLDPEDSDTYIQRENVQFSLMYYQSAIEDYTIGINYNSENGEAYYNRGLVYLQLEDQDKALADFQQAAAIFPQMLNPVTKLYINGYKIPITGGLRGSADPASPPDRSIFQNIIYPI